MTKDQVNEIKKIINSDAKYTTYYSSKTQELRVRVFSYNEGTITPDVIEERSRAAICTLLKKLSSRGLRPKYRIDKPRYQGFINDVCVVFR